MTQGSAPHVDRAFAGAIRQAKLGTLVRKTVDLVNDLRTRALTETTLVNTIRTSEIAEIDLINDIRARSVLETVLVNAIRTLDIASVALVNTIRTSQIADIALANQLRTATLTRGFTAAGLTIGTDKTKVKAANTSVVSVAGIPVTVTTAEYAFTATTHDIAPDAGAVREAVYLLSIAANGAVTVTKGTEAAGSGAAAVPATPANQAAIGYVRIEVAAGVVGFDATTDELDEVHITATYVDLLVNPSDLGAALSDNLTAISALSDTLTAITALTDSTLSAALSDTITAVSALSDSAIDAALTNMAS